MSFVEVFIIALGLSLDAFAIALCKGLSVQKIQPKHLLNIGLWFGGAQIIMSMLGFILGSQCSNLLRHLGPWITFGLLLIIGIVMLIESRNEPKSLTASFSAKAMLPLSIANSMDALIVGVSFSFLEINVIQAVILIGLCTFLASAIGIKIGNLFGIRFKSRAEIAGGLILILMAFFTLFKRFMLY